MLENTNRTDISTLGEFGLIEHLTSQFENKNNTTLKGVGDDAAVIKVDGKCLLVTTDLLLEGIHFDLSYYPLKHLAPYYPQERERRDQPRTYMADHHEYLAKEPSHCQH